MHPNSAIPSESTPKFKVLIVENEELVRNLLAHMLTTPTYSDLVSSVETAENGNEGIEKCASFAPDIIISDIQMPEMDGLTMGSALRAQGLTIPIIYLSTVVENTELHQKLLAITPFYLMKSGVGRLREAIEKALASRRP
jgi:CheY-like chemotaxis protein